jgi:DNA-binding SARP family transcriptional activator
VELRILGPLEIGYCGRVRAVGAARHRAVLAILLLNANRTVTLDTLVDLVWGERPPAQARVTIRNYVCRLRKILPEPVLRTTSSGYVVDVPPAALDLTRFEELVGKARAIHTERPEDAAAALSEALALWRGPALADLGDTPVRQIEAPRLEELRQAAIEDLIDAELRLGHEGRLVAELQSLVARYPLRERLVAQLMLALHRCGRRTEALEAYQRLRDTYATELGLSPSQFLRQLHHQILSDDPAVSAFSGKVRVVESHGPVLSRKCGEQVS